MLRTLLTYFFIFCVIIGTSAPVSAQEDVSVNGTVLGEAPDTAAVITSPLDGQNFTTSIIPVSGTCPTVTIVKIYRNDVFAGSTFCDDHGLFTLNIGLFEGYNTLIARVFNYADQAGPDSEPVTVTYTPIVPGISPSPEASTSPTGQTSPTPPTTPTAKTTPSPKVTRSPITGSPSATKSPRPTVSYPAIEDQFRIRTDYTYRSGFLKEPVKFPIEVLGGLLPYTITVDWGDSRPQTTQQTKPEITNLARLYNKVGNYAVKITAKDSNGKTAYLELAVVINAKPDPRFTGNIGDAGNSSLRTITSSIWYTLRLIWPLYLIVFLIVTSFWLGERYEKRLLFARWRNKREARKIEKLAREQSYGLETSDRD